MENTGTLYIPKTIPLVAEAILKGIKLSTLCYYSRQKSLFLVIEIGRQANAKRRFFLQCGLTKNPLTLALNIRTSVRKKLQLEYDGPGQMRDRFQNFQKCLNL